MRAGVLAGGPGIPQALQRQQMFRVPSRLGTGLTGVVGWLAGVTNQKIRTTMATCDGGDTRS
jgi:hypothetical protein